MVNFIQQLVKFNIHVKKIVFDFRVPSNKCNLV